MKTSIIRGRTLSFKSVPNSFNDKSSYNYNEDGAIFIKDGIINEVGSFVDLNIKADNQTKIYDHRPHLVIPGFIDTHLHYPQIQIVGSYAANLLEWLNTYTFYEEQKYNNSTHCTKIVKQFFDTLINYGTTTAAVYCTVHVESVEAFFSESNKRNMLMIGGKIMMDRNAPTPLLDTANSSYDDTTKLINKWHGIGRQHYAISPRFAITSTPEQMTACKELMREHPDCYFQTHLSENIEEVALANKLYPDCKDYTGIYERYNLLGSHSLFGHCIHLKDREIKVISETNSVAIFCPTSNLFLGSGLFNIYNLSKQKKMIRIGTATDIGGGTSYSMLKTMDEAYKILQMQKQKLSPFESFYQITLGNARALSLEHKIGTLEPGSDADIIILNSKATNAMKTRMETTNNLSEELFVLQTMGDDRAVSQVYIKGSPSKNNSSINIE